MTWRAIPDWPDPSVLLRALGAEIVQQRAANGEGEAQFSQGCLLVSEADGNAGSFGLGGRSPLADVGFALSTYMSRIAHRAEARRCGRLTKWFVCGC